MLHQLRGTLLVQVILLIVMCIVAVLMFVLIGSDFAVGHGHNGGAILGLEVVVILISAANIVITRRRTKQFKATASESQRERSVD